MIPSHFISITFQPKNQFIDSRLTIAEVADRLQTSIHAVRFAIQERHIHAENRHLWRKCRILESELNRFLRAMREQYEREGPSKDVGELGVDF